MKYDVIIIGAGPAGLSASIFTSRAGLKTLVLEKLAVGGQASLSYQIANYPGFEDISGFDLMQKMEQQAISCGVQIEYAKVESLTKQKSTFVLKTKDTQYQATKVIIACGSHARKLGLDNEQTLTGRGISYCASCDGGFYKNKVVAVVGGGNTAVEDVTYLSKIANKVYLINRSEHFRAGANAIEKIKKLNNVEIISSAIVTKLVGEHQLQSVELQVNGKQQSLTLDGLFVAIGYEPDVSFVDLSLKLDSYGYILVDKSMRTNVKYLYACGDIISKDFRQIITACSDGAIAGNSCIGD